eukprot:TRINITY_DN6444_c1_g1_i1.p10 TRINITY_DN6444_c1_g1~~TRINITY_DN6444_c1_g1_i1.p10  ORF type:complete len:113 (+),score=4.87 TRINITY_DN6444_c1_g1_i1:503-841(+)
MILASIPIVLSNPPSPSNEAGKSDAKRQASSKNCNISQNTASLIINICLLKFSINAKKQRLAQNQVSASNFLSQGSKLLIMREIPNSQFPFAQYNVPCTIMQLGLLGYLSHN